MDEKTLLATAVAFRRKIHQFPELGWREFRTTALVAGILSRAGISHKTLKPTGVIAWLSGDRKGPCVALRADMDALPITEAVRLPFKSKSPGVMHACGHDAHTAMLLAAA